jgi:acetoin utilization deacetylase AcuC-like enzyme
MTDKKVGLVYSEDFILHETGHIFVDGTNLILQVGKQRLVDPYYTVENLRYYSPLPHGAPHPERPERTALIYASLEATGLLEELQLIPPEAVSDQVLEAVHDPVYVATVRQLAQTEGGCLGEGTLLTSRSYEIARLSAGAGITAAKKILAGELKSAFVLSRPPGHHASRDRAAGFCIFNNAAILTRYWLEQNPNDRVFIIDWDVHHGDGTQSFFYEDKQVFYLSLHQYGPPDLYPGTGGVEETGTGAGLGFTANIPLPGKAGDKLYLEVFEELVPALVAQFKPNLILVSAGQDGHFNDLGNIYLWDPPGGMALTAQCYHRLTQTVSQLAETYCEGKYILQLEGGYNLRNLSNSVVNSVSAMLGLPEMVTEQLPANLAVVNEGAAAIIQRVRQALT